MQAVSEKGHSMRDAVISEKLVYQGFGVLGKFGYIVGRAPVAADGAGGPPKPFSAAGK
jgi:hypothetical protein